MTSRSNEFRLKHILLSRNCLAIVLQKERAGDGWQKQHGDVPQEEDGVTVFRNLVNQNSICFWNQCLVKSVSSLEFKGCLVPMTVLVGGTDFALEVVRSAWARRVLRPPKGYTIIRLGDISVLEMRPVPQTQFAPLSEALCKVIVELNSENVAATAPIVASRLAESFPKMEVPGDEILYKTLGGLIKERKLYHTGRGYFVVSPDTYRQRALSPLCERQMLMTNEEAIIRLHGEPRERTLAVQVDESDIAATWREASSSPTSSSKRNYHSSASTSPVNQRILPPSPDLRVVERRHSLKVLRVKGRPSRDSFNRSNSLRTTMVKNENAASDGSDSPGVQRCEKQSMFSKLFRRMQLLGEKPAKHVTFSAQFPPLEWLDSEDVHSRSIATQTQVQLRELHSEAEKRRSLHSDRVTEKIPWHKADVSGSKIISDYSNTMSFLRSMPVDAELNDDAKKIGVFSRTHAHRHSPSHRYSYGPLGSHQKRHHRHRRSSSESPKIEKVKRKETDLKEQNNGPKQEVKQNPTQPLPHSLYGNVRTSNPKAIITPCSVVYKQPVSLSTPARNINIATQPIPSTSYNIHSQPSPTSDSNAATSQRTGSSVFSDATSNLSKNSPAFDQRRNVVGSRPGEPEGLGGVKEPEVGNKEEIEARANSESSSDMKLSLSDSNSECPIPSSTLPKISNAVRPITLEELKELPKTTSDGVPGGPKRTTQKEITIDNSVNVEVAVEKIPKPVPTSANQKSNNVSTTVSQTVTEETTVSKGPGNSRVVTVTSVTTSLSHGSIKDIKNSSPEMNGEHNAEDDDHEEVESSAEKSGDKVNDLNSDSKKGPCVIDCSSSCNIVTEVK